MATNQGVGNSLSTDTSQGGNDFDKIEKKKEANNPIGDERSHSIGNDIIITIQTHVGTSPTNESEENKIKGLLNFIVTFKDTLSTLHLCLATFSVTYPASQKALVSYNDSTTKAICSINIMTFTLCGLHASSYAAHFKGSKSTDHIGFDIFLCALFVWWLALMIEWCITLTVYLQIDNKIVWPVGIAIFFLTSFTSVAYIEYQRPLVSKWAKDIWKKIKAFLKKDLPE